jgi:hypothetical protein
LRNVRIVRGGASMTVDLYGLIGIGSPPSARLRDGDRIIVPVIGDTVAIAGSVSRPGIYEIRKGATLGSVLDYAGGALRPRGNQIAISRIAADGSEQYLRAASLATSLVPGDAVQLTGGSAGGSTGRVVLRGFVANPGARALVSAPTVRDLLGEVGDVKTETYLPMAVLICRDPATAARVFEPVNLLDALTTRPGVALRSDDRLYVFSRNEIDFINRTPVRRIVLGQANTLTDCAALDQLETRVRDSQTARFNVVTRNAFIVERGGQSDVAATGGNVGTASRFGDEALRTGDDKVGLRGSNGGNVGTAGRRGNESLRTGDDKVGLRGSNPNCPAVFEEEPELLPVLIENAVSVGGSVRRPGGRHDQRRRARGGGRRGAVCGRRHDTRCQPCDRQHDCPRKHRDCRQSDGAHRDDDARRR